MDDKRYSELKLQASITPEALRWPEPRLTHLSRFTTR
jgi:hypothetical protein